MTNPNVIRNGTQRKGLCIIIGRCSLDSQHVGPSRYPANFGCSYIRYTNNDQNNHSIQRHQRKKWTREDNRNVLHRYLSALLYEEGIEKE